MRAYCLVMISVDHQQQGRGVKANLYKVKREHIGVPTSCKRKLEQRLLHFRIPLVFSASWTSIQRDCTIDDVGNIADRRR